MNKIIAITALLLFVVSGISFAADLAPSNISNEGDQIYGGPTSAASQTSANMIGKLSKGVILGVNFDNTNGLNYAIDTKHSSGTMIYGTADDSTAIFRQTVGTGALTAGQAPSAVNNTAFATGWTTM